MNHKSLERRLRSVQAPEPGVDLQQIMARVQAADRTRRARRGLGRMLLVTAAACLLSWHMGPLVGRSIPMPDPGGRGLVARGSDGVNQAAMLQLSLATRQAISTRADPEDLDIQGHCLPAAAPDPSPHEDARSSGPDRGPYRHCERRQDYV